MFDSALFQFFSYAVSIFFLVALLTIPANVGNLVAAIFASSMAAFLGGDEESDAEQRDLEDEDI